MKSCANMSSKQCAMSDRLGNLQAAAGALTMADECLREEGLYVHGSLPEMLKVVELAIKGLIDEFTEGAWHE